MTAFSHDFLIDVFIYGAIEETKAVVNKNKPGDSARLGHDEKECRDNCRGSLVLMVMSTVQ